MGCRVNCRKNAEILCERFTLTLGSSSAILAHNLALFGSKVTFSSRIGCDVLGEMCCRGFGRRERVEVGRVVRAISGSNTEITLILPLTTTRRILTYLARCFEMGIEDLDLRLSGDSQAFSLSSLFCIASYSPAYPRAIQEDEATRTDHFHRYTNDESRRQVGRACLRMSAHSWTCCSAY